MVRKLVTPGRVLTPAEKMRRYREKPKNKAKIKEYEQSERRVNSKKLRDMTIRKEREKVVFRGQKRRPPSTEVEDSDQDEAKDDEEGGRRGPKKRSHANVLEKKPRADTAEDDLEEQQIPDMPLPEETEEDGTDSENDDSTSEDELKKKLAIKTTRHPDLSKKSRQAIVGEKMRRKNQDEMKSKLETMEAELRNLRKDKASLERVIIGKDVDAKIVEKKLEKKVEEVEKLKLEKTSDNNWVKFVYRNLSASARKEFKKSVNFNKGNFCAGTLRRLRQAVGVNFSQVPTEDRTKLCFLATKVRDFAMQQSAEIPDMKAQNSSLSKKSEAPSKRSTMHHLTVLHSLYNIENPESTCSYSSFINYWPSYISKPNLNEFTSCHCEVCENSSMISDALIKHKVVPASMDIFSALKLEEEGDGDVLKELSETLEETREGSRKDEIVTFTVWEKVQREVTEEQDDFNVNNGVKRRAKKEPMKRLKSAKICTLCDKALGNFRELKEHLRRNRTLKTEIKRRRDAILTDPSGQSAQIFIDWSDGLVLRQQRETQAAFFASKGISLQTGYVYTNSRSFGFGSFCEGSDHKVRFVSFFFI